MLAEGTDYIVKRRNSQDLNGSEETTTYAYTDVGSRESVTYPNNTKTTYTYDTLGRLTQVEALQTAARQRRFA